MTNLTEQCKQRKLPDGLYWVKHDGVINILDNYEAHLTEVEEVLAPVPSYEEYQQLLSDQLAKNEGVEINAELEAENTNLKELLKECKPYIQYQIIREKYVGFTPQSANVLHKINQVLGEDK